MFRVYTITLYLFITLLWVFNCHAQNDPHQNYMSSSSEKNTNNYNVTSPPGLSAKGSIAAGTKIILHNQILQNSSSVSRIKDDNITDNNENLHTTINIIKKSKYGNNEISWEKINGPVGGYAIRFTQAHDGTLYAGVDGGVSKSTDDGKSWIGTGLYGRQIRDIIVDTNDNIYAADYNFITGGVFKSTDKGNTWFQVLGGVYEELAINSKGYIYAAGEAFIYSKNGFKYSTDFGNTWERITSADSLTITSMYADDDKIIIGRWESTNVFGISISTDNGLTWSNNDSSFPSSMIYGITVDKIGNIYAGTNGEGVFKSIDQGHSWTAVNNGLKLPNDFITGVVYDISCASNNYLYATRWGSGIFRSTNEGSSWTQLTTNMDLGGTNRLYIDDNDNIYFGVTKYIYRSTDLGLTWSSSTMAVTAVKAMQVDGKNNLYVALIPITSEHMGIGWQVSFHKYNCNSNTWANPCLFGEEVTGIVINDMDEIFLSLCQSYGGTYGKDVLYSNNGITWNQLTVADGLMKAICSDENGYLYVTGDKGIFISKNNGSTWSYLGNTIIVNAYSLFVTKGGKILVGTTQNCGVFRSTDEGITWLEDASITNISAFAQIKNGTIFACTGNGIYQSSNNGENWSLCGLPNMQVLSIIEASNGNIYIGTKDNGVYCSTDFGQTWEETNTGLNNKYVCALAIDKNNYLYAGTYGDGVYTTKVDTVVPVELTIFEADAKDYGIELKWTTATELNNKGFEIQRSNDKINFEKIVFVYGHGSTTKTNEYSFTDKSVSRRIHYYRLKQIDYDGTYKFSKIVEINFENTPREFSLAQNYPNPFNPTTTINYSIPQTSFVTIKVYDVLGNEITTLVNEEKKAGNYSTQFAVGSMQLPSGVYFYRMQAGDFAETKKLILVK